MNPQQLLNPKQFAKEKEKAKASKKTPNYGPQQTRKPAPPQTPQVARPQAYDPRTLLNPKAASAAKSAPPEQEAEPATNGDFGAAHLYEDFHGLTSREDVPVKKRKQAANGEQFSDDEDGRKRQKSHASGSKGGIITEGLKEDRKNLAAQSGPSNSIDLTNDTDDVIEVEEVQQGSPEQEVCLGTIDTSVNAFRVPAMQKKAQASMPKTHWPAIKVTHKRQPSNNSIIELFDALNSKFGSMDLRAASALSPLLDATQVNKMRVKMILQPRPKNNEFVAMKISLSLKMQVTIFAPRKHAQLIGKFLSQKQLFLRNPTGVFHIEIVNPHEPKLFGPSKTAAKKPLGSRPATYVSRSVEEMRREANNMFDDLAKNESLPLMDPDKEIVKTELMEHQKQALAFLMDHERSDYDDDEIPRHSLWKYEPKPNGAKSWYHIITGLQVSEKPDPVQGGILADMMGLGKTLSIIALIAESKAAAREFGRQKPDADMELEYNARGTLIICPKSVLSNWNEQIGNHTLPGALTVYNYHGTTRTQDTKKLARYDVVLTSYNTAAAEFSDTNHTRRALNSIHWFRIVLDEAHSIRTVSTKVSKAACALYAQRRWAVTGTPVQNSLHDLGALIKFLRIHPLDSIHAWNQYIMSPFKAGDVEVIQQLQILVGSITLRRLKDKIELSSRKEEIVKIPFSDAERALYNKFLKVSRINLDAITGGSMKLQGKAYAHVLKSLGRLRQICAHGRELLTEDDMKEIDNQDPNSAIVLDIGDDDGFDNPNDFAHDAQAYGLYKAMQDSEMDICQICARKLGKRKTTHNTAEYEDDEGGEASYAETPEPEGDDFGGEDDGAYVLGFLTPCYHLICPDCKEKHEELCNETMTADKHNICPHCDTYQRFGMKELTKYGFEHFIQDRQKTSGDRSTARWDEDSYTEPHTKVKYLIQELDASQAQTDSLPGNEPPIRSVVFSGWTQYLDLIGYALEKRGIGYARLDGSMSVKARSTVIAAFQTNPQITVLLVSIKAGGQGLNFTAANKVYIMEPQFNPGVEQQAADRVHRLGQKRNVEILHLIMEDSIEGWILELQRKKEALAKMSLEKKRSQVEDAKERLLELRNLFK